MAQECKECEHFEEGNYKLGTDNKGKELNVAYAKCNNERKEEMNKNDFALMFMTVNRNCELLK